MPLDPTDKIVAEAVRIDFEKSTGRLFIVFEVTDPQMKQKIKSTWYKEIYYRIIGKTLVQDE